MSKKTMSHEVISREATNQEPKGPEMEPQEIKKMINLRANTMPVDGYVLSVDGKLKKRYESAQDAAAAGAKLKQSYPVIQIAIYDASERIYTPVNLPGQEKQGPGAYPRHAIAAVSEGR